MTPVEAKKNFDLATATILAVVDLVFSDDATRDDVTESILEALSSTAAKLLAADEGGSRTTTQ